MQIPAQLAAVATLAAVASADVEEFDLVLAGGEAFDSFGAAVAVDAGVLCIGAPGEDTAGSSGSGAVYLFDAADGSPLVTLLADDGRSGDGLGVSVAADGGVVLAGAAGNDDNGDESGSAYLFDRSSGAQLHLLLASDGASFDDFGLAVAVHGGLCLIGAPGNDGSAISSGAAYLFDAATGAERFKLVPSDGGIGDSFGFSVALHGSLAVVGARYHGLTGINSTQGAAYVFDATTGLELGKLVASDASSGDSFGWAVGIHGARILVGAPFADVHGPSSGAAYLFDATTLSELAKLAPNDGLDKDYFGRGLAVGASYLAIGSPWDDGVVNNSGSVYLYDASSLATVAKLAPSAPGQADHFGQSIAISAQVVLVGSSEADPLGTSSGRSYVFAPDADAQAYCTAGTSSSGCSAMLGASGVPSATAPTGFVLSATGVEGAKDGLFFFGTSGRQANPWGNGTSFQCVVPPVTRAGLLVGGGTVGGCDGLLEQDLCALWCAACPKPQKNPGAGSVVQAQLWYRDPANTSNQTTGLSNAIEFALEP